MRKEILCWNKQHPNVLEYWNALINGKYIFSTKEAYTIDKDMVRKEIYYTYKQWEKVNKEHKGLKVQALYPNDFTILQ